MEKLGNPAEISFNYEIIAVILQYLRMILGLYLSVSQCSRYTYQFGIIFLPTSELTKIEIDSWTPTFLDYGIRKTMMITKVLKLELDTFFLLSTVPFF